jgi:hypothetical protein
MAKAPNQSMKPTRLLQETSSVFATTPCRGLFLSYSIHELAAESPP